MSTPTPITERSLAEQIGVAREIIRAFRIEFLHPETHFGFEKKGGVTFTPAGLALVLARFEKKEEGAPRDDAGTSVALADEVASAPPNASAVFYVAVLPGNLRVLLATAERTLRGPRVTVRVRDNRRFAVGMEIEARHAAGATWIFHGRIPSRRSQRTTLTRPA